MSGRRPTSRKKPWNKVEGPVLIVDDDLDDAKLTKRALEAFRPSLPLAFRICQSGKDFVAYLEGEGAYSDRSAHPLPSLVLLDLKMPEMDGFAVLEWVKAQPKYANIPIVVLSGLEDSTGLKRAYSLNARSYLFKPVNVESFHSILTSLNISM
jgi:CheY-like chemotaxis protein